MTACWDHAASGAEHDQPLQPNRWPDRHAGYAEGQRKRKRNEEVFGWMKTVGLMHRTRHRDQRRVGWVFTFTVAVYNRVRLRNLAVAT